MDCHNIKMSLNILSFFLPDRNILLTFRRGSYGRDSSD